MKALSAILLLGFGALMLYAVAALPPRFDVNAPAQRAQTPAGSPVAGSYYVEQAYADAETPNIVTVILADYRGYDTLGETSVVFTAGMACYLILRRRQS